MTRLLLRDAARRYGAGIAAAILPLAYLGRSLPPQVVRDWVWTLPPGPCVAALAAAMAAYLLATFPIARLLLASGRLEYWRQFPIPGAQWRGLMGRHLALVNLPVLLVAGYLLAPTPSTAARLLGSAGAYALAIAGQWSFVRLWPASTRVTTLPYATRPVPALARLYALTLWRRQPGAVGLCASLQLALVGLAALGWVHVARVEPAAAAPLLRTLVVLAALAAAWPLLVLQRALDRDHGYLDALGIDVRSELAARGLVAAALGSVTLVGVALASVAASGNALAFAFASVAVGWAAAAVIQIGARAEARRELGTPRPGAIAWRAVYGLSLVHLVHPAALGVAALIEGALAWRSLHRARHVRARLETTNAADDHD